MLVLLVLVVCTSCKEAGDMIENQSGSDVQVLVTTFGGATIKRTIPKGMTFAFPNRGTANQWHISRVEAIGADGKRIGVFDAESLSSAHHLPHVKIIIHADRLSASHRK
jgi:hypothetical protein